MKAQYEVVREILIFAAGILIVVSTAYLFNRVIIPKLRDYSVKQELMNVESHVSFLIKQSCALASQNSIESNITFSTEMPQQILNYPYIIYFNNGQLCVIAVGTNLQHCNNLTYPSNLVLMGSFHSGGNIIVNCLRVGSQQQVSISEKI
jgi:hypothetical protein